MGARGSVRALKQVESWGVGPVAVGVVTPAGVVATRGDIRQVFALASVTKLIAALAIHVACEEGTIHLDDPVGPPGSSLAHLLAHASGLGPDDASAPVAPPATRRIYSNAGIELAGEHLARCSGMPAVRYLEAGVLEPLEMGSTRVEGSLAYGAFASLVDLLALVKELLEPKLVHEATLEKARSVAFPGLAGLLPGFGRYDPCDWGLGPELRSQKRPHWTATQGSPETFGHFGQSGSFVWVDPVAKVGCAMACRRPFGPWARRAWPLLADDILDEVAQLGDNG